jgi:2-oxoglutarate dehydrogenase E1 component
MQVIQPTTAAQIFHVLRRQMIRQFRKPLILMTPKSLLRNKEAASPLSEFTKGGFQTILPEHDEAIDAKQVTRLVMCSGKVYYDLVKLRTEMKLSNVAIIRLEQLYPFPHKALVTELKKYSKLEEIIWCQDEPQNQGAWFFVQHNIFENMTDGMRLAYAGRPASASPACGYAHLHQEQLKSLLNAAFAKLKGYVITK